MTNKPKHKCPTCECGKPWKPELDDAYFYIGIDGVIEDAGWNDDSFDKALANFNNVFRTAREAEAVAEKVKALLLSLRK